MKDTAQTGSIAILIVTAGVLIFLGVIGFGAFQMVYVSPTNTPQKALLSNPSVKPSLPPQASPTVVKESTPAASIAPAKTSLTPNRYETKVFSFVIPDGYEVEERVANYYSVIPKGGYSGGMEGMHIDTRTEMPISIESKLSEAKIAFKDLEIKDLNGWKVITGTQKAEEGVVSEGMSFKDAYLDLGDQVVAISSSDKNSFGYFEPLIGSIIINPL